MYRDVEMGIAVMWLPRANLVASPSVVEAVLTTLDPVTVRMWRNDPHGPLDGAR